jgi:curved DNA-binding protein CbpA
MEDSLKAEFKSRRSSLGGSGAFHGSVQQVAEASDREYYAFLNVTPESSEDEIKAAYKRLALLWHPDRHKDEEARERATAQFAKLTQIHDVLTDSKKRKLYDLYGEKGLASGMEVGAHLRTHDQVRDEYLRQMAKKNQKRLEAKLGVSGTLQTSLDMQHVFKHWLQPQESVSFGRDRGGGGVQEEEPPVLKSAMLDERFRTTLSKKDTLELHGQIVAKASRAYPSREPLATALRGEF